MPFKSEAQRRKFLVLLSRGEISKKEYDHWDRATGDRPLPERLHPKRRESKGRKVKQLMRG